MRNLLHAVLAVACIVYSAQARCAQDTFKAIDKLLDQQYNTIDSNLEQRYQQLDQAMENAYRQLGRRVGKTWGKGQVRLPSMKVWVDYSPDLKTRRIIDFARGKIELDRLVDAGDNTGAVINDMTKAATSVTRDTDKDIANKDLALKWARQNLSKQGIHISRPHDNDKTPMLAGVAAQIDVKRVETDVARVIASDAPVSGGGMSASIQNLQGGKREVSVEVPFKPNYRMTLADRYLGTVTRDAHREGLPVSLVLAVMDTESAFNPRATSPIPAYGLMQLVPSSGAMDAYQYLNGSKVLLDPEYLYNPQRNVQLGSAYLSLLKNRYLSAIKNDTSRQYCTIAAYNTGAGNVARAFTHGTDMNAAADVINAMTPTQVYNRLRTGLPYEETRNYIQKVTRAQKQYMVFDRASL